MPSWLQWNLFRGNWCLDFKGPLMARRGLLVPLCVSRPTPKSLAWPDVGSWGSKSTPKVLAWAAIGMSCKKQGPRRSLRGPTWAHADQNRPRWSLHWPPSGCHANKQRPQRSSRGPTWAHADQNRPQRSLHGPPSGCHANKQRPQRSSRGPTWAHADPDRPQRSLHGPPSGYHANRDPKGPPVARRGLMRIKIDLKGPCMGRHRAVMRTETPKVLAWPDMGSCGSRSTSKVLAWAAIGLSCEQTGTPKAHAWPDMGSCGSRSTSKVLAWAAIGLSCEQTGTPKVLAGPTWVPVGQDRPRRSLHWLAGNRLPRTTNILTWAMPRALRLFALQAADLLMLQSVSERLSSGPICGCIHCQICLVYLQVPKWPSKPHLRKNLAGTTRAWGPNWTFYRWPRNLRTANMPSLLSPTWRRSLLNEKPRCHYRCAWKLWCPCRAIAWLGVYWALWTCDGLSQGRIGAGHKKQCLVIPLHW